VRRLTEAGQLYTGELLPGYFDPWILSERQRLAAAFQEAVESLLALLQESGDYAQALPRARRLVSAEPLSEAGHQALIRLLVRAGQPDAARQHCQEWERLLWQSGGQAPDPDTHALIQAIQAQPPPAADPAADRPRASLTSAESSACIILPAAFPSVTVTFLAVTMAVAATEPTVAPLSLHGIR
jgi:DNA-binding SARP family transcriptional activator